MLKKQPCPICGRLREARASVCRQCYLAAQGPDGDLLSEHERFWSKVDKNGPIVRHELGSCWMWKGSLKNQGYGMFSIKRADGWIKVLAHRYSYELLVGKIPEGVEPDHLCRNPACVNPQHLEIVSHSENLSRGIWLKGNKAKTCCSRGHPYNEKNTYMDKKGRRTCRVCHKEAERQWKLKQPRKEEVYGENNNL